MGNHHHHRHSHHHDQDFVANDDKQITREEKMVEGSIRYHVDDPRFIEMAKWPIILLDTTGSMKETTSSGGNMTRKDLVYLGLQAILRMLSAVDDADSQPEGWQRGCPLITFNAAEGGLYRGFFHPDNLQNEWANIQFHGATHIMDGWRTLLRTYENYFTERKITNWPLCLCLIITDGELQDGHEFEKHLAHVHGRLFVEIAVVGYGEDHDRAVKHYRHISKHHHHVTVTAFTGETDPYAIATQLLRLVDPKLLNMNM